MSYYEIIWECETGHKIYSEKICGVHDKLITSKEKISQDLILKWNESYSAIGALFLITFDWTCVPIITDNDGIGTVWRYSPLTYIMNTSVYNVAIGF